MYVYVQSEPGLWTVGHYEDEKFVPESDHDSTEKAAKRVRFLNGGNDPTEQLRDQFAGQALAGLLAGGAPITTELFAAARADSADGFIAKVAYIYADAMLKARGR